MAETSLVEYARYHGLTDDHTKIDVLDHLDLVGSVASNEDAMVSEECLKLSAFFTDSNERMMQRSRDEPLQVSQDALRYLQLCSTTNGVDVQQAYQSMLPDHKRFEMAKLPLPLLMHGDPVKDAIKIRKAINLEEAIDDMLDDFNEAPDAAQLNEVQSRDYSPMLASIVQQAATRNLQQDSFQVSRKTLQFLYDMTSVLLPSQAKKKLLDIHLPPINSQGTIVTPDWFADDFVEDAENNSEECSGFEGDTRDAASRHTEAVASQSEFDFLSQLDTTIDMQLNHNLSEGQRPTSQDHLQTIDNEKLPCTPDCLEAGSIHADHEPGATNSTGGMFAKELAQSISGSAVESKFSESRHSAKCDLPHVEDPDPRLPNVDLVALEKLFGSHPGSAAHNADQLQPEMLPFQIRSVHDLLRATQIQNEAQLADFRLKSKAITRSETLLWKEPGLRILDLDDIEDMDIKEADSDDNEDEETSIQDKKLPSPDTEPLEYVDHEVIEMRLNECRVVDQLPTIEDTIKPITLEDNTELDESVHDQCDVEMSQGNAKVHELIVPRKCQQDQILGTQSYPKQEFVSFSSLVPRTRISEMLRDKGALGAVSRIDSIGSFLGLRGKQFRNASTKHQKGKELSEDPIISSQMSFCSRSADRERTLSPTPVCADNSPEIRPLRGRHIIVVNEVLLRNKPLLVRFLEQRADCNLTLIYRTMGSAGQAAPDLILNARTCLHVTSLQALCQRPLPGQKSNTSLSAVHDLIALLIQEYDCVFVLVHYVCSDDNGSAQKVLAEQSCFAAFCDKMLLAQDRLAPRVVPIWVSISKPSSTADIINAWVWKYIADHGSHRQVPAVGNNSAVREGESDEERFLVRAGLNPLAAQLAINTLKVSCKASGDHVSSQQASLGDHLLSMTNTTRHGILDNVVGQRAVNRLNNHLSD